MPITLSYTRVYRFQSTPSTRRVTNLTITIGVLSLISIHTLHTEGDAIDSEAAYQFLTISIHTLHTEGDSGYSIK